MVAAANEISPAQILTKSTFTIPVDIKDRDDETGAEVVRKIFITYHYDQDTQDEFKAGIVVEVDNPAHEQWENAKRAFGDDNAGELGPEPALKIQSRREFTNEEQIRKLIVRIRGVETLDESFWRKTPPKHKAAMLEAIMEDIFPNLKSSGG